MCSKSLRGMAIVKLYKNIKISEASAAPENRFLMRCTVSGVHLTGGISHSHKCYKKAPHCKKQCGAFLQRFSFSGQNSSTLPNNKSMKLQ